MVRGKIPIGDVQFDQRFRMLRHERDRYQHHGHAISSGSFQFGLGIGSDPCQRSDPALIAHHVIEIVLVRHGEPDWEPGGRAVDHPVLSERGRRQAECVADELAGQEFDGVYVSPLPRAQETAAPLLQRTGWSAQIEPWLEELRLPSLEGKTSDASSISFARSASLSPKPMIWTSFIVTSSR